MNFKTNNWQQVRETNLKYRVQYFKAKLELTKSGKAIYDSPTVIVSIWSGNSRYVGIAQCSKADQYSPEKGREIAAGRALKNMLKHTINPAREPDEIFLCEGEEALVYGTVPDHMVELIHDSTFFDHMEKQ